MIMCKFRQDACDAYCNIAKQHDFCKDEENCPVFKLQKENEELKKNTLVWHKVTCFDKPDENGFITTDAPAYDNREYLVRTKRGHYLIQELRELDIGVVFEDYEWEEVDKWAELPMD